MAKGSLKSYLSAIIVHCRRALNIYFIRTRSQYGLASVLSVHARMYHRTLSIIQSFDGGCMGALGQTNQCRKVALCVENLKTTVILALKS